ncbi:MAG: hypothetical protein QOG67_2957 [Verrucomicrobiota bacterium]
MAEEITAKTSFDNLARALRQRWRRQIKELPLRHTQWHYSRSFRSDDPIQGWKIHVSATVLSANDVFARVRAILIADDVLFKAPASLELLAQLNAGVAEFSQVGKFLTVYPRSADEAVQLAQKLHKATRGLEGPEVPFDARYRKRSLVHYRYGVFRKDPKAPTRFDLVFDSVGKSHQDRRAAGYAIPRWLQDPFRKAGDHLNGTRRSSAGPIGRDFLVFKVITQRGKGGVYEAMDLSSSPARLVIIKEGRQDGEISWDGKDGFARVRHEGRVLRELRSGGVPVPEVYCEFTQEGNRYLVCEKVSGRPLLPASKLQPNKASWRRARRILEQLEGCFSRMHAVGWVWRDCKPWHIFVHRGKLRLIDFEGACRPAEKRVLPWGSLMYAPKASYERLGRAPGMKEDDYALGVVIFQLTTGKFPPASSQRRKALYQRAKCPNFLRNRIDELLRS